MRDKLVLRLSQWKKKRDFNMNVASWHKEWNGWVISADPSLLNRQCILKFLVEDSYWGKSRTQDQVNRALDGSTWVFGLYRAEDGEQVGFCRVVSDSVTVGYLTDVFVLPKLQGQGLGKFLISSIMEHPGVAQVGRMILLTETPEFYELFGFTVHRPVDPMELMQRKLPGFL